MSYLEPAQLKAFAGVLEKAAERNDRSEPRWSQEPTFCLYRGRKHISYQPDSPTGNYAPLAGLTFRATGATDCEACVMGLAVAVCVLDLVWDSPYDASQFLNDLESWLNTRVPHPWDSVMGWSDRKDQLTPQQVSDFLRMAAADANRMASS